MFGIAGRRAAELVIGLFALLGFVCVPLGRKTGFEHLVAIVQTPQVVEAASDLVAVGLRLRLKAASILRQLTTEAAELPPPTGSARPQPVLPELGTR